MSEVTSVQENLANSALRSDAPDFQQGLDQTAKELGFERTAVVGPFGRQMDEFKPIGSTPEGISEPTVSQPQNKAAGRGATTPDQPVTSPTSESGILPGGSNMAPPTPPSMLPPKPPVNVLGVNGKIAQGPAEIPIDWDKFWREGFGLDPKRQGPAEIFPDSDKGTGLMANGESGTSKATDIKLHPDLRNFIEEQNKAQETQRSFAIRNSLMPVSATRDAHGNIKSGGNTYVDKTGFGFFEQAKRDFAPTNYQPANPDVMEAWLNGTNTRELNPWEQKIAMRNETMANKLVQQKQQEGAMRENIRTNFDDITRGKTSRDDLQTELKTRFPDANDLQLTRMTGELAQHVPGIKASENIEAERAVLQPTLQADRAEAIDRVMPQVRAVLGNSVLLPENLSGKDIIKYADMPVTQNTTPDERTLIENSKRFMDTASHYATWPTTKVELGPDGRPHASIVHYPPAIAGESHLDKMAGAGQRGTDGVNLMANPQQLASTIQQAQNNEAARRALTSVGENVANFLPPDKQAAFRNNLHLATSPIDTEAAHKYKVDHAVNLDLTGGDGNIKLISPSQSKNLDNLGPDAMKLIKDGSATSVEDAIAKLLVKNPDAKDEYGNSGGATSHAIDNAFEYVQTAQRMEATKALSEAVQSVNGPAQANIGLASQQLVKTFGDALQSTGSDWAIYAAGRTGYSAMLADSNVRNILDNGVKQGGIGDAQQQVLAAFREHGLTALHQEGGDKALETQLWNNMLDKYAANKSLMRLEHPELAAVFDMAVSKISEIDTKESKEYSAKYGQSVPPNSDVIFDKEKTPWSVSKELHAITSALGWDADQIKERFGVDAPGHIKTSEAGELASMASALSPDAGHVSDPHHILATAYHDEASLRAKDIRTAFVTELGKVNGMGRAEAQQVLQSNMQTEYAKLFPGTVNGILHPESSVAKALWQDGMSKANARDLEGAERSWRMAVATQQNYSRNQQRINAVSIGASATIKTAAGMPVQATPYNLTLLSRASQGSRVIGDELSNKPGVLGQLGKWVNSVCDNSDKLAKSSDLTTAGLRGEMAEQSAVLISIANATPGANRVKIFDDNREMLGLDKEQGDSLREQLLADKTDYSHANQNDMVNLYLDGAERPHWLHDPHTWDSSQHKQGSFKELYKEFERNINGSKDGKLLNIGTENDEQAGYGGDPESGNSIRHLVRGLRESYKSLGSARRVPDYRDIAVPFNM